VANVHPTRVPNPHSASKATDLAVVAVVRRMLAEGDIRRARKQAGLSIGEVAKTLGLYSSTLARWERGERTPRPAQAVRAAGVFEELVAIADLVEQGDPQ